MDFYENYLDDIYESYIDTDFLIKKVDIYTESLFRQYDINKDSAELLYLSESVDKDRLQELYLEAGNELLQKISISMQKLKNTVKSFINKILENLENKYLNYKMKESVKDLEKKIDETPNANSIKIEIVDIDSEIKIIDKTINTIRKIGIKNVNEDNLSDLISECNDANLSCQKERKKIHQSKVEITLAMSISVLRGRIKKCSKNVDIDKYLVKIRETDSNPKQQLALKINGILCQLIKEKKSVQYAGVQELYKKINNAIKGNKTSKSASKVIKSVVDKSDIVGSISDEDKKEKEETQSTDETNVDEGYELSNYEIKELFYEFTH